MIGIRGWRCVIARRFTTGLMQLRNQLEPNGNVMATVVSLEMSVLLLLSSLIFRLITYIEKENKFRSVSNNNNISMGLGKRKWETATDLYHCSSYTKTTSRKKISKSFLSRELKKHQMNYSGRCAKRFGLLLDTNTAENYTTRSRRSNVSATREYIVHIHKSSWLV
jgi:hypothetical protein